MEYRATSEAEMAPGTLSQVNVAGTPICLVRTVSGDFRALSDVCSHEEAFLSEGDLFGNHVECPMHGSLFNLDTGAPDRFPAVRPVETYPVTVRDGEVFIEL